MFFKCCCCYFIFDCFFLRPKRKKKSRIKRVQFEKVYIKEYVIMYPLRP